MVTVPLEKEPNKEPNQDLAHLGHVELLTPKLAESLRFFRDVLGLTESGWKGESVYLRGWDDYERHTLKLTASKTSGLGHMGFRARSQQALERRVAALKGSGYEIGWTEGDLGHGPAYLFQNPDGHKIELYYETEWYVAPPELHPGLKNQPQRFPARGISVRRLEQVECLAADVQANREFFERYLGLRMTEQLVLNDGTEVGAWMTCTNKGSDVAFIHDDTGARGRFHHLTYAVDSREEVLRAADIFLEDGVFIESGPHKHAIQQTFYLWVYEPGGNRVEVDSAGARLILAPDWKPVRWTEEDRKKGQAWGLKTVESLHTYGTPSPDDIFH
jgi:catechol 2,3-dioxygenase